MKDPGTDIQELLQDGESVREDIASIKGRLQKTTSSGNTVLQKAFASAKRMPPQETTAPILLSEEGKNLRTLLSEAIDEARADTLSGTTSKKERVPSATMNRGMNTKTPSSKETLRATISKDEPLEVPGHVQQFPPEKLEGMMKFRLNPKSSPKLKREGQAIQDFLTKSDTQKSEAVVPVIQTETNTAAEKTAWEGQVQKDFDAETLRIAEERNVPGTQVLKSFQPQDGEVVLTKETPSVSTAEKVTPEITKPENAAQILEEKALLENTIRENASDIQEVETILKKERRMAEIATEYDQKISELNNFRKSFFGDTKRVRFLEEMGASAEKITAFKEKANPPENNEFALFLKRMQSIPEDEIKKAEALLTEIKRGQEILVAKLAQINADLRAVEHSTGTKKEEVYTLVPPETLITPSTPLFNKEKLSAFEQEIANQESIESLTELLVSKEYKDHVFGSGTRAVSGSDLAKRISEKVLQAKKGSQVDPYFFIPDAILAHKVHELLETSLSWQESVSEFGTLSFEKKDSEIKEEVAQKAIESTIRKVEAVTNPGMLKKVKSWLKTEHTGARNSFWVALGAAVGLWGATEAMDIEKTTATISTPTEATAETSQSNVKTQKMNELFNEAKSSSVKASTSASSAGIPTQSKPDAQPFATNAPAGIPTKSEVGVTPIADTPVSGVPTQPETNVAPITDTPDYISGQPQSVTDTPDYISPKKEISTEKSLAEPFFSAEPEKPKQFYSINEMRNWFSQDKQKLAAFERVLHYADGQEEKGANGQPNVRAFWWETMQLEKVSTILPNKARSQNRNLTHKYVNYHIRESGARDSIIELQGLDDNQFMTTGAKLRDFDTWYKNSLLPATQQLEQKITQEEKEGLADTTQTLGEYLTQVVYLGEKYGVQIKGIPELTEAQQQKVQNFQPIKVANKVSNAKTLVPNIEKITAPTENTYWADGALRGAELHGVGNSISNLEWLNGPFENMIRQYWDRQSDMKINHRGYTRGELHYLKGQFEELKKRAAWPTTDKGSLRQVDRVLADIETQLGASQ